MLGTEVSGTQAAEWGIIHRCVPDDQLDSAAEELVTDPASFTERRTPDHQGR